MKNFTKFIIAGLFCLSSSYALAAENAEPLKIPPVEAAPSTNKAGPPPAGPTGHNPDTIMEKIENAINYGIANQSELFTGEAGETAAKIKKSVASYKDNQKSCQKREDMANTMCIEGRNPDIANYISIASVIGAGANGMMDACSKFGKVMDLTNKALTAYQAQCAAWKGFCSSSCKGAVTDVESIKKNGNLLTTQIVKAAKVKLAEAVAANDKDRITKYEKIIKETPITRDEYLKSLEKELVKNDHSAVATKLETCQGYAKEVGIALVGILSAVKSYGEANDCEKKTKETAMTTPTPVDCTVPANKQNNMTCICQDAPRTPGCDTNLENTAAVKNADALRAASGTEYNPNASNAAGTSMDLGAEENGGLGGMANTGDGGGSLPGGPTGGSAGIDGGGGLNGGGPEANQKAGSRLNANILSGESGGGGGGGWGSGGGGMDRGLRQFLPGGQRDPAASGLAGAAASKQVTSQGGKSNWEKVRERYRDNKPSLLGY